MRVNSSRDGRLPFTAADDALRRIQDEGDDADGLVHSGHDAWRSLEGASIHRGRAEGHIVVDCELFGRGGFERQREVLERYHLGQPEGDLHAAHGIHYSVLTQRGATATAPDLPEPIIAAGQRHRDAPTP